METSNSRTASELPATDVDIPPFLEARQWYRPKYTYTTHASTYVYIGFTFKLCSYSEIKVYL